MWPPTEANLERLGRSLLDGEERRPLDAERPFDGGEAHLLRAGERLVLSRAFNSANHALGMPLVTLYERCTRTRPELMCGSTRLDLT